MKSICQTSNGSLTNSECLGGAQTGFSGLCFGRVGQEGRHSLWPYEYFPISTGSWMLSFYQCQAVVRGFVSEGAEKSTRVEVSTM